MSEWSLKEWMKCKNISKKEQGIRRYYYEKISRLATSQFDWECEELPYEMLRMIEILLWMDGYCLVWKSKQLGWVVSKCSFVGYDVNNNPNRYRPVFINTISGVDTPELTEDDECFLIWDSELRYVPSSICCGWIDEIADIQMTISTQIFNQKTPLIVISSDPKEQAITERTIQDIGRNAKAIFLPDDLRKSFQPLSIEAPFKVPELQEHIKNKESEIFEFLGIDSQTQYHKAERLITDEQESNNQILSYMMDSRYDARLNACENAKKHGLTISVTKNVVVDENSGDNENADREIEPDNSENNG